MTVVVLMGPPGAGKGTHAEHLAGRLGVPAISTGDIFRANVEGGTELGQQVRRYLDAGQYVPDELTKPLVRDRCSADDTRPGFLLDGYPRTVEQAVDLDALLASQQRSLDAVVVLEAPVEDLVARLLHRAEVEHRSDDTEGVIRRRLQVYSEQTVPLINWYDQRPLVHRIDSSGDIQSVGARIDTLADSLLGRQ